MTRFLSYNNNMLFFFLGRTLGKLLLQPRYSLNIPAALLMI